MVVAVEWQEKSAIPGRWGIHDHVDLFPVVRLPRLIDFLVDFQGSREFVYIQHVRKAAPFQFCQCTLQMFGPDTPIAEIQASISPLDAVNNAVARVCFD